MSSLHASLITGAKTLSLSTGLYCSIITGAKSLSLSGLCHPSPWKSRNSRALMLMAPHSPNSFTGCFDKIRKHIEHVDNQPEGKDANGPPHKKQKIDGSYSAISNNSSMVTQDEASEFRNASSQDTNIQNQACHRPLINCPKTKEIWREFKGKLESGLRARLRELTENDFSGMKHGLEIVDSLHLLKLFNISNPEFEAFVQMADDGEKQLREGLKQAKAGYDKLKLAVSHVL